MHNYSNKLSSHLKRLRTDSGFTLEELSHLSGVSRATLSRIEKAETSPTADTLGTLSNVYNLPISALLTPLEKAFSNVVALSQQPLWEDKTNGFIRRSVSPPSSSLSIELIEGSLNAHQKISYDKPSFAGQEHHLVVLQGDLYLEVENKEVYLSTGDCIRYKLYGSSVFLTKESSAKYIIALSLRK